MEVNERDVSRDKLEGVKDALEKSLEEAKEPEGPSFDEVDRLLNETTDKLDEAKAERPRTEKALDDLRSEVERFSRTQRR